MDKKRDCVTCPSRVECSVCHKKLCHTHEDLPEHARYIEGHYNTPDGVLCENCVKQTQWSRKS